MCDGSVAPTTKVIQKDTGAESDVAQRMKLTCLPIHRCLKSLSKNMKPFIPLLASGKYLAHNRPPVNIC